MRTIIVYEDESIIVVHKPSGLATETSNYGQLDMVSEIKNYLASKSNSKGEPYLGLIHRLDQPVEGILVVAKNQQAAKVLSAQIANNQMQKIYYAVIFGNPKKDEDTLIDYLYKDSKSNLSKIVDKNTREAKRAELDYKIIARQKMEKSSIEDNINEDINQISLAEIKLLTGRHHQIRVQMSNAGIPLLGDLKYGSMQSKNISTHRGINNVALCAYKLHFIHPLTNKKMEFKIKPTADIFHNLIS